MQSDSRVPKLAVVVAGGLGAIEPFAAIYYYPLCHTLGAELILPHGAGFGESSETYRHFEAAFDRLSAESDYLVIVGHSLGAIHAVRYAATHDNVLELVLIGMPVEGSVWCRLLGPIAPIFRDLMPHSPYLAEMNRLLIKVAHRVSCIEVSFDLFVVPAKSCHVPGARRYLHLHLPWMNHVNVVHHWRVLAAAKDLIEEAELVMAQAPARAIASL